MAKRKYINIKEAIEVINSNFDDAIKNVQTKGCALKWDLGKNSLETVKKILEDNSVKTIMGNDTIEISKMSISLLIQFSMEEDAEDYLLHSFNGGIHDVLKPLVINLNRGKNLQWVKDNCKDVSYHILSVNPSYIDCVEENEDSSEDLKQFKSLIELLVYNSSIDREASDFFKYTLDDFGYNP